MKRKIMFLIFPIVIGFILGVVIYSDYKNNLDNSVYNAYLIQIGSFNDDSNIDKSKYLVILEDGIYNVYAGITTKLSNAIKIKEIYEEEKINSIIKPTIINNIEFISNLKQYDLLLSEINQKDNIKSVNDVIISNYEELVLGK